MPMLPENFKATEPNLLPDMSPISAEEYDDAVEVLQDFKDFDISDIRDYAQLEGWIEEVAFAMYRVTYFSGVPADSKRGEKNSALIEIEFVDRHISCYCDGRTVWIQAFQPPTSPNKKPALHYQVLLYHDREWTEKNSTFVVDQAYDHLTEGRPVCYRPSSKRTTMRHIWGLAAGMQIAVTDLLRSLQQKEIDMNVDYFVLMSGALPDNFSEYIANS